MCDLKSQPDFIVKMSNTNWREDDLARGLAADLFNLSGLGVEDSQIGAYDMSYVFHLVFCFVL